MTTGRSQSTVRAALSVMLAALGVAVAAWLVPAFVQITAWPRSGPVRVALLPQLSGLWWALAGAAVAAGALWFIGPRSDMGRSTRAHAVAPLAALLLWLLPFLPWLPDRLPVLLVLAGPLRWLIAAGAAIAVARRLTRGRVPIGRWTLPGRRTVLAVSLGIYLFLGWRSLDRVGIGGDEPHYLVITHSLLADGDLKIENNHAQRDYRAFYGGEIRPDYLQRGVDGEIYSIHAPGLSALLLPGYALGGAGGAIATLCLIAALAAVAIFDVGSRIGGPPVGWLTWAAICLTVPFIPHAWAIFPEIAGAAIVAWAVSWLATREQASVGRWAFRGLCLAVLPWLHTKFIVLMAAAALALGWSLRKNIPRLAALMAPMFVSGIAWMSFFYVIYGRWDPQAPYGASLADTVSTFNVPRSLVGLLFDQKFGLLVYAPIYAVAGIGAWWLARDRQWRALVVASLAIAALFATSTGRYYMWWGGSSAPARFLVPVLPLLAPLVAAALVRLRAVTAVAATGTLIAVSLVIAAAPLLSVDPLILFSDPHGISRLADAMQGSAPLTGAMATFTEPDWPAPLVRLLPWLVAAAIAVSVGRLTSSRTSVFWNALVQGVVFLGVAAALVGTPPLEARNDSVRRGRATLIEEFDPPRLQAFGYDRFATLDPSEWLADSTLVFDLNPSLPPDRIGRVTEQLSLPPGRYEAKVWFQGPQVRNGDLQITLGRGGILSRVEGPLPNPAVLTFDMPLPVPGFWLQLTDQSAAQGVLKVEISALSGVPRSERPLIDVRAVEAVPGRQNAYLVHPDRSTFPEGSTFWTMGAQSGRVLLAPAGASELVLTLHVGPNAGSVRVTVGGAAADPALRHGDPAWLQEQVLDLPFQAEETRTVTVPLPAGVGWVPVTIQAPAAFRPADVDPASTDTRELGCQVRLELR